MFGSSSLVSVPGRAPVGFSHRELGHAAVPVPAAPPLPKRIMTSVTFTKVLQFQRSFPA